MMFVIFAVIALITGAKCSPQHGSEITETPEITENTPMDDVITLLKFINDNERKMLWVVNMVDKQCVVDKYSDLKLLAYIPSETNKIDLKKITSERNLSTMMFTLVIVMCNRRFDAFMDYAFENLMTTHILYNAMKDEPEFKTYSDMITCANYHAETKNMTDVNTYNLNFKIDDQKQCDEWIAQAKTFKKYVTDDYYKNEEGFDVGCVDTVADSLEELLLKQILLMQVELPTEQKKEKRIHFKESFSTILDSFLVCNGKITREVLEHSRNAEKLGIALEPRFLFFSYKESIPLYERPALPPFLPSS